jgi:hypothetical protein
MDCAELLWRCYEYVNRPRRYIKYSAFGGALPISTLREKQPPNPLKFRGNIENFQVSDFQDIRLFLILVFCFQFLIFKILVFPAFAIKNFNIIPEFQGVSGLFFLSVYLILLMGNSYFCPFLNFTLTREPRELH